MAKVSVIIPTMKGREDMLKKLLASINSECEKIVVDDENLLLASKRNKGAKLAKGDYLLFIDDDNYLREGAIQNLVSSFKERHGVIGMVACYHDKPMLVADGGSVRYYISGFTRGLWTNWPIYDTCSWVGEVYEVDEVANAFMIRRDVFDLVGGFDEQNFPIDLDEADICKRIKDLGYLVCMNQKAICYHKSQTYSCVPDFRRPMSAYFMGRNRIFYQRKHLNKFQLALYFLFFFPLFVLAYCACLLYRRKPWMVLHFLLGVFHGIVGKKTHSY